MRLQADICGGEGAELAVAVEGETESRQKEGNHDQPRNKRTSKERIGFRGPINGVICCPRRFVFVCVERVAYRGFSFVAGRGF
jgi:hypothetical protein